MSGDGFHIDGDGLRTHASHLESAGEGVGQASDAVGTVHLDVHAFGLLCAGLIPLVSGHEHATASLISSLDSVLGRSADGMRQMATDYEGSDTAAEARFKSFDASLGA